MYMNSILNGYGAMNILSVRTNKGNVALNSCETCRSIFRRFQDGLPPVLTLNE
jgi:hypothetical protein